MKLLNKKTGEIKEVIVGGYPVSGKTKMWECSEMDMNEETGYKTLGTYCTLAELNAEWEDAPEEEKEYWYIEPDGSILQNHKPTYINHLLDGLKSIGNYFETKEEAEKAVKKLKAWKRLKDKGFRFVGVRGLGKVIDFDIPEPYNHIGFDEYEVSKDEKEFYDDLHLLFGGKE